MRRWRKWLLLAVFAVPLESGSFRRIDATEIDIAAQAELRDFLIHPQLRGLNLASSPEIQRFYFLSGYSLAWSRHGVPTSQAVGISEMLTNARTKGLDPEDYGAKKLAARLVQMSDKQTSCVELAKYDLEFTAAAIHFATDLSVGRIDPHQLQFALNSEKQTADVPDRLVHQLINAQDVSAVFSDLEPPFRGYRRTEAALLQYLGMEANGEDPPIVSSAKQVRSGESFAAAEQLQRRLIRLGDLPQSNTLKAAIYSVALAEGVKHFQQRHGLNRTGILDQQTLTELNTPIAERVTQLELTLERWRWLPSAFDRPPIVVNIPEFKLRGYDESHHASLTMPVIVGKPYRHQTPVFQDGLEYVIFRPYWNVPLSIQRTELVPAIAKDPGYLPKHGFEITTKAGELVSMNLVTKSTLEQLRSGRLGIRQRPGAENALGLIKFVFPNRYDVYLHGTPAQELFRHARRDFSHGCIRVQDPVALAAWVLRSDPLWTVEHISEALNGADSVAVKLPQPIPVLILYGTAIVEENEEVYFFRDIYGHDAALLNAVDAHSRGDQVRVALSLESEHR